MKVTLERSELVKALAHVHRVVERRNTIPILANVLIRAGKGGLELKATDLDLEIIESVPGEVKQTGATTVPAHIPHRFKLAAKDFKRLVEKTQFAISTEETRYYLNGIYLHAVDEKGAKLRAVATDGHRLAQVEIAAPKGANGMPGVIVPRKTVAEVQRLLEDAGDEIEIELSPTKVRFTLGKTVLTSKLIDGTFPDYARVIPVGNDKTLVVEKSEFAAAVDRVSTVSSERGRAVKLSLSEGKLTLSVTNPDSGSATEELEVEYSSDALDIGFNSRYLLDITSQIEGEKAELKLADPGSPTLLRDKESAGALYVLM